MSTESRRAKSWLARWFSAWSSWKDQGKVGWGLGGYNILVLIVTESVDIILGSEELEIKIVRISESDSSKNYKTTWW